MLALTHIKHTGEIIHLNRKPCDLHMAQEYVSTGMGHALIENAWTSKDSKLTLWCNEEGLLNDLPYNALASGLVGGHIVGDVLLVENEKKDFE